GFGPFRRRGRMADLVNALATVAPTGLVDLNARLADCLPEGARQPLVIVASDLMTPDGVADGLLALQSRHADVVVLHVVSPDELEPDLAGEVELIDAETNASLELGVSLDTLRAYRQRLQTWLAAREADCITHGMRYVRLMTDRPLADVIMDDLRRGGVLR
ncbi:MAG TPA: hypothetical protein VGQ62_09430, partial [Chloroflexota bacterium]|nr:hypothetical protein [Chloroflexota bacterium]